MFLGDVSPFTCCVQGAPLPSLSPEKPAEAAALVAGLQKHSSQAIFFDARTSPRLLHILLHRDFLSLSLLLGPSLLRSDSFHDYLLTPTDSNSSSSFPLALSISPVRIMQEGEREISSPPLWTERSGAGRGGGGGRGGGDHLHLHHCLCAASALSHICRPKIALYLRVGLGPYFKRASYFKTLVHGLNISSLYYCTALTTVLK